MDTKFHARFHNSPSPEPDESSQFPRHTSPTVHRSTVAQAVQTSIQQSALTLCGQSSLQHHSQLRQHAALYDFICERKCRKIVQKDKGYGN